MQTKSKQKRVANVNGLRINRETIEHNPSGTAYILTKQFAKHLIDHMFPIIFPVDIYIGDNLSKKFPHFTLVPVRDSKTPDCWTASLLDVGCGGDEGSTQNYETDNIKKIFEKSRRRSTRIVKKPRKRKSKITRQRSARRNRRQRSARRNRRQRNFKFGSLILKSVFFNPKNYDTLKDKVLKINKTLPIFNEELREYSETQGIPFSCKLLNQYNKELCDAHDDIEDDLVITNWENVRIYLIDMLEKANNKKETDYRKKKEEYDNSWYGIEKPVKYIAKDCTIIKSCDIDDDGYGSDVANSG